MSDNTAIATDSTGNPRMTALITGAFLALVFVCCKSLLSIASTIIFTVTPYVAGVGMFAILFAVFCAVITMLKAVRKTANRQALIRDCFVAICVIGVLGYVMGACVAMFQPGLDASELWMDSIVAAATTACIFGGGKYLRELFEAGKNA